MTENSIAQLFFKVHVVDWDGCKCRQWPIRNGQWAMVGNGMEAEQRKAINLPSWRKSSASHFQKLQTRCVEQSAGIEHVENFERNNFTRLNSLRGND